MGTTLSRWRAAPSTVEQLESLDKEIKELEEFRAKNQRLVKLWVGRLLLYSALLYLLTCLLAYCLYLPSLWSHRLLMACAFSFFPVLIWLSRNLLVFLFAKRTERNNDKLEDLKVIKRKILEEVMETETYKNAKVILERFDPDSKRRAELENNPAHMTPRPGQELRQRAGRPLAATPSTGAQTLAAPGGPPERLFPHPSVHRAASSPVPGGGMPPPPPALARPILPREQGALDRIVEYLVGDGPQNRYALICQQCFSHNGMALKEEFEYLAFRCAYCYLVNPARKTRPQAPRLPEFSFERRLRSDSASPGPSHRTGPCPQDSPAPSADEREDEEEEVLGKPLDVDTQSDCSQQQEEAEQIRQEDLESDGGESAPSGPQGECTEEGQVGAEAQ